MQLKTEPRRHQLAAIHKWEQLTGEHPSLQEAPASGLPAFALLMDMGTGKTKTMIDIIGLLYEAKLVDGVIVVAPNGVHANWVRNEIPKHLSDDFDYLSIAWQPNATKAFERELSPVLKPKAALDVITINYEAMFRGRGREALRGFLKSHRRIALVADESVRIKNPSAESTKAMMKLGKLCAYRFILTGYPIPQGPIDFFSQFKFLDESIIGLRSLTAFRARYAELLPQNHPMVIAAKRKSGVSFDIQLVATDARGRPMHKNLDELLEKIDPYSIVVRKSDVLDLPPKVFEQRIFKLSAEQARIYKKFYKDAMVQVTGVDGGLHDVNAALQITKMMKWQQISGGFIYDENTPVPFPENPKLKLLLQILEEYKAPTLIYAWFRPELDLIFDALKARQGVHSAVRLGRSREITEDIAAFQAGIYDVAIGQTKQAGIGHTITRPEVIIYYSQNYDSDVREQSEDRAHRIGLDHSVTYIDLVGEGTEDEKIIKAVIAKREQSDEVLGKLAWY